MVKGELRRQVITKEELLSIVDPFDVYLRYFGRFQPNVPICNHLRGERDPSFIIGTKSGAWRHWDFGDGYWRGDCIDLVQQIYRIGFTEAIEKIDSDFRLGLGDGTTIIPHLATEKSLSEHSGPPFFQVIIRPFKPIELEYWNSYHLDGKDLAEADIYAPHKIWRNRRRLTLVDMTFCYYYEDLETWKLYRPLQEDNKKIVYKRKWDTGQIPFDYCDGLNDMKECTFAYLTKSRKDRMVLRKALGTDCVSDVQAEDPHCISDNTINIFKERSEIQVTVFDNDNKGKLSSQWLTNEHGFRHCNVPDGHREQGITDFADLARAEGLEAVFNHFNLKGLV